MAHSSYTLSSVQSSSLLGEVRSFRRRPSPARTAYFRRSPIATAFAFRAAPGIVSNEDWVGISGNCEYDRLLPCRSQNRPPRVEHLVVVEGGPVLEYICKALDLPPLYVADLISFGAVYYALVSPTPPPNATQEQVEIFKRVTAPSVLQKRTSIKGKTVREAQKTYRITCPKEFVETDTYLRVYVHPKRFPRNCEYDRLLPCRSQNRPPRVEHLVVVEGGPVLEYICKALDLPPLYVADLISFGAVYYALVSPTPPPNATQEQVEIFKRVTAPSVLQKRTSIKGKTVREAQKTYRITCPKEFVETDTYLRVYVHPKRFPRCYELDWKSRIIAMTETYVVIDKPAATSVGGTTNNIVESCANFTSRALGLESPLLTTHQIDNCTEGCVVLSRTKDFCSYFHGLIREKKVEKLYLALAVAPVPIGVISHYMRPVNRAPRVVSEDFIERWHLCQLEVLECREIPWPSAEIERENSIEDCGWPLKHLAYECKIKLLTGKTHQIRAQLAAIGSPIVGDSMYMSAFMREKENPKVNPFGKIGRGGVTGADVSVGDAAISEWIGLHGKEPVAAIGLQAHQISWDDDTCLFNAGTPWWR